MEPTTPPPRCPVVHVGSITPCPADELAPLLSWLAQGAPVAEATAFPRGTALPDGRLDLCKQSLGVDNARALLRALPGQPQVRHLLMGTDGLGDEGARAVAAAVAAAEHLETVYLGCNAIGPDGARALTQAVAGAPQVTGLWLKRNPLGLEGADAIAELLSKNNTLTTLDLHNTALGDEGVARIAAALPAARGLRRVYLGANGAGPRAAAALAAALLASPRLEELYLDTNPLGDEGLARLAPGLGAPGLRVLSLASNGLGPRAGAILADALRGGALETLTLGHTRAARALDEAPNALGEEGAAALWGWLATDPPLRRLWMERNGLTTRAALALEAALATNRHLTELRLGSHVARRTMRRLSAHMARSAAALPPLAPPPEVLAIQSVYR